MLKPLIIGHGHCRYMGIEILAKARQAVAGTELQEVVSTTAISV
jgi:hypothetical protein